MKKRIICFGDSNTWGYNPVDGSRYDENTRWPMRMQALLGDEYTVIEEGLSGRCIANADPWEWGNKSALDYVMPMIESHDPFDLLIIMLGGNDLKLKFSLPPADIAGGMQNLLMKAKGLMQYHLHSKEAKILVVSPPYLGEIVPGDFAANFLDPEARERSKQLAYWFELVAQQFGVDFMDVGPYVEPGDIDKMHLMPEGHERLAQMMADKVRELL